MRSLSLFPMVAAAGFAVLPAPCLAQDARAPVAAEPVSYRNAQDGMALSGMLSVPQGAGPFPGVVVLSIAGADPLIEHLTRLGHAVLLHERRGMISVEQLLRASYSDLGGDALAAVEYLRSRPDVDAEDVSLVGQGEDAPAALVAAAGTSPAPPLVLLSVTGLPGGESFRIEQLALATERGYGGPALEALERYVDQLSSAVLEGGAPGPREARLRTVMAAADVELPRGAAFPHDAEGQARFFASRWWLDRLSFRPDELLARLDVPVLVLMGTEDPFTPWERHLPEIRRNLESAPAVDATVCLVPGRVRHNFSPAALEVVGEWLADRPSPPGPRAGAAIREACLEEAPPEGN